MKLILVFLSFGICIVHCKNFEMRQMERQTSYGCGSPNYTNDIHCDDENNNAGCLFDGGACCNQNIAGWDEYCTDCECLTPTTTTTTTTTTTSTAAPPGGQNCVAVGGWSGNPHLDEWCNNNCNHIPSYCPESFCSCA